MDKKALEILQKYYGYKTFRKGQEDIINSILNKSDVLGVMPTGGGKSICYQIPSLILDGVTIVISPLISLMKDQVDNIKTMGIEGAFINSSLSNNEFIRIIEEIKNNKYKIIYIAPERLESFDFCQCIKNLNISQIAIDEAHCISQWGHDFRTSYRKISTFIDSLEKRPIITAFTATASKEVREDIITLLRLKEPKVFITGFDRENLSINIIKSENKKKYLLNYIEDNKMNCGIIYAATRKEVDNIYEFLKKKEYSVGRYHGGLSDKEREENQENFIHDKTNIMVATNAFGMGIDKSNIRYVIHYNMPKNIESYYQEIGRAGRDGEKSECILLFAPGDIHIQKYLIDISVENYERKNSQYKKLQQMVDFVYSNDCYRKYILNYFGETYNKDCNNCSNCLNEGDIVDKTLDSQKVLSCIYRMKRPFGTTMLIDVLRGSKNKKVLQYHLDEITTYGLMKDYSQEKLKNFINTLISHGYIDLIEGDYPVLSLNNRSTKVLKGEEKVKFKEFKMERKAREDNKLFILLKELRHNIAGEEGIPPYMIFSDSSLKTMSIKYPRNKKEMLLIPGVGEIKYERYGENFEKIIKSYIKENNINIESTNLLKYEEGKEDLSIPFEVTTDLELFTKLNELRINFAKKEKVLPQMILSKNTLKELSGRYPTKIEDLKDISGIGPKKIDKYGENIINIIRNYVEEKKLSINWEEKKRRKLIIDGDGRSNEELSLDMLKEGKTLEDTSREVEVSVSTILGYVTDFIKSGEEFSINLPLDSFYNENEEKVIIEVCEKIGYEKISDIKRKLPDTIKYESIRAVILKKYYLGK